MVLGGGSLTQTAQQAWVGQSNHMERKTGEFKIGDCTASCQELGRQLQAVLLVLRVCLRLLDALIVSAWSYSLLFVPIQPRTSMLLLLLMQCGCWKGDDGCDDEREIILHSYD